VTIGLGETITCTFVNDDLSAGIDIEKSTNGDDADTPTGPFIPVGDAVNWEYVVTNPGLIALNTVVVTDDILGVIAGPDSGDTNSDGILEPGEIWVYSANGVSVAGQYANVGTVTAVVGAGDAGLLGIVDAGIGDTITDEDPSHYFGSDPSIDLVKTGVLDMTVVDPADRPDVGDVINYTFTIENTGNVNLTNVTLTDNRLTDEAIDWSTSSDPNNPDGELLPGETVTGTGSHTLIQVDIDHGIFNNRATTEGTPPVGDPVTDDDTESIRLLQVPDLEIVKAGTLDMTVVDPADRPDVGDVINYTFSVTNTGNVTLTDVVVNDTVGGVTVVGGPIATMAPGDVDTTTFTGTYVVTQADIDAGDFYNCATADGTPPGGQNDEQAGLNDAGLLGVPSDESCVTTDLPQVPEIDLIKTGTFQDESGDGFAQPGETISYMFRVENTGNVTLTHVTLADTVGGVTISGGPIPTMAPGDVDDTTFTGTYAVTQADIDAGTFDNIATVTGIPPAFGGTAPPPVTDDGDAQTPLPQNPDIGLFKNGALIVAEGDRVVPGDKIVYTFTVENTGNVTLRNLDLIDLRWPQRVVCLGRRPCIRTPSRVRQPGELHS
jgi:uncharacterized repeat protein (TIGR01451 family)